MLSKVVLDFLICLIWSRFFSGFDWHSGPSTASISTRIRRIFRGGNRLNVREGDNSGDLVSV